MIETSSGLPRKSSETFLKMFGTVRPGFGKILKNFRKVVGNLWKIVKNAVISMSV